MKSLAVKYRPTTFKEVCGNNITVKILEQVLIKGTPKNAYLLTGPSGCGKTTCARIFANELNKSIGEPIEIDAASNNGVDQVRAIVESAKQRSLVGTYKIFIIIPICYPSCIFLLGAIIFCVWLYFYKVCIVITTN